MMDFKGENSAENNSTNILNAAREAYTKNTKWLVAML
jgi:hypothetical protein